jgi:hypothetical protein
VPPNKALQLTGPQRAPIDVWYYLALTLGRLERAAAAGPAAERPVRQAALERILNDPSQSGGNSAARIGIVLLGIFFITSGVGVLGGIPDKFLKFDFDAGSYIVADNYLVAIGASVAGTLLFRLLPGALLIVFRDRIANRIFPTGGSGSSLSESQLYVIGCTLLSFYVLIYAASGVVASIRYSAVIGSSDFSWFFWITFLARFLASLTQLALGVALYQHARRCAVSQ